jgi:four helix bundle protein
LPVAGCRLLADDGSSLELTTCNLQLLSAPEQLMPKTFRELDVWNKAIDLTELLYGSTADFPKHQTYGLSSQMQRAAVSVASNIAEGSARGTRRDFRQFVKQAEGSNCELQTQLIIARRLGFGDSKRLIAAEALSVEIGKMLGGLATYLAREIGADRSNPPYDH